MLHLRLTEADKAILLGVLIFRISMKEKRCNDMADTEDKKDDTIEDKEDVIETQNEGEKDKEDVIEDEVKDDERMDADILDKISELFDGMQEIREEMKNVRDNMASFVDAGVVIREDDDAIEVEDSNDSNGYVAIEDLDLTI